MTRRIRSIAVIAAVLLPALMLGGWLLSEQVPVWTAPQAWWVTPADAPAACAAAATLTAYRAVRSGEAPAVTPADALNRAEKALEWGYRLGAPPERASDPLLVRGQFGGESRLAWMIAAQIDVGGSIVYIDALSGETISLIAAAAPNAACPFDVRGALVDMARSRTFALFAGYVALVIGGALIVLIMGRLRSRQRIR